MAVKPKSRRKTTTQYSGGGDAVRSFELLWRTKERPSRGPKPGLSLDPGWRKWLQQKLRFEAERGKTVLVTTHLIAEWNDVADRCLLCRDGITERELDPRNLPDDFDEVESGCDALVAEGELSPRRAITRLQPFGLRNKDSVGDQGVAATWK